MAVATALNETVGQFNVVILPVAGVPPPDDVLLLFEQETAVKTINATIKFFKELNFILCFFI